MEDKPPHRGATVIRAKLCFIPPAEQLCETLIVFPACLARSVGKPTKPTPTPMSKGTISAFFKPGPKPAEDAAPAVTPISAFFKPSAKPESNADSKPAAAQAESAVAAAAKV